MAAKAPDTPVDALLREIVEDTGYRAWLERQASDEAKDRLANVEELVSAASEFVETSGEGAAAAFLEQVSLVSDVDLWKERDNAVSLMTLHNAKGLEFTVVLIPGLEDGLLPHDSSLEDDDEMEEERRLFYVGMTRAKDELYLFAADTRRRAGVLGLSCPSRFIDEIDRRHLEVVSAQVALAGPEARAEARRAHRWSRRVTAPAYEDYSQDTPEIGPGTRVRHPSFGDGVVVDVSGGGLDSVVRVRFDGGVEKRIMLRFAKLEILPD